MKKRKTSGLSGKPADGRRRYPLATVAFYGPDDTKATKVVVGIFLEEGAEPAHLERWLSEQDIRGDLEVMKQVHELISRHRVRSLVMSDRIIGCPHEEGVDYPEGRVCPRCPFWASRDRWTGEKYPVF